MSRFLMLILAGLWTVAAFAGPADKVTYQGKLLQSGVPADGEFDFTFDVYDAEANGQLLDTQTVSGVTVTDGVFSVILDFGDPELFIADRWLEVTVDQNGKSSQLSPRSLLTGTPVALRADVADQAVIADLATLTDADSVNSSSVIDGSLVAADVDSTSIQQRITAECPAGQSIRAIAEVGTVTCEADDAGVESVVGGTGLISSGSTEVTLDLDTSTIQTRVTGACGANEAIQSIDANGNVVCETDDNTNNHGVAHAGYDSAPLGIGTISSTSQNHWDFFAGTYGDASLTLAGGEKVMVTVGAYVYKDDLDATTDIKAEISPCYSLSAGFSSLATADFPGKSRFQVQSTGALDQVWVQASYVFTGLASGTHYFTLCTRRLDSDVGAADFAISAPKVTVLTFP